MKTCEVCGRRIRTGYKYCYEHRHGDHTIDRATRKYIKFHKNRTSIYLVVVWMVLLIPFGVVGLFMSINQCLTIVFIGGVVSFILSIYICMKYLDVAFNPRKDVDEKHPRYVRWIQDYVDKEKANREFRKTIWNR